MKKITLIILGAILLVAFTPPDKPYVYLHGLKYYECRTITENNTDTIFEPGGFIIIKSKSKIIVYDHFKCDGIEGNE